MKNQLFHAHQPRERIFDFYPCSGLILMTDVWSFGQLFQNEETFFQIIFFAQIISFGWSFSWFHVKRNKKNLDDL